MGGELRGEVSADHAPGMSLALLPPQLVWTSHLNHFPLFSSIPPPPDANIPGRSSGCHCLPSSCAAVLRFPLCVCAGGDVAPDAGTRWPVQRKPEARAGIQLGRTARQRPAPVLLLHSRCRCNSLCSALPVPAAVPHPSCCFTLRSFSCRSPMLRGMAPPLRPQITPSLARSLAPKSSTGTATGELAKGQQASGQAAWCVHAGREANVGSSQRARLPPADLLAAGLPKHFACHQPCCPSVSQPRLQDAPRRRGPRHACRAPSPCACQSGHGEPFSPATPAPGGP